MISLLIYGRGGVEGAGGGELRGRGGGDAGGGMREERFIKDTDVCGNFS